MYARFSDEELRPATMEERRAPVGHRQLETLKLPSQPAAPRQMAAAGYERGASNERGGHESGSRVSSSQRTTRPASRNFGPQSLNMSASMPRLEQRPSTPEQIYKAAKADLQGGGGGMPGGGAMAWLTPGPSAADPNMSSRDGGGMGRLPPMPPTFEAASGGGRLGDADFVSPYDEHHKLKRELKRLKTYCEQRLAQAERDKISALERQYIELSGSIEEKLRVQMLESKEERVELLRRQIVRRMVNAEMSNAWNSWAAFCQGRTHALRHIEITRQHLQEASGLAPSFEFWAHACDEQRRVDQLNDLKDRLRNLEARLARAEEDKRVELERQLIALTGPAEERMKLAEQEHKEAQVELLRRQMVRRMMNSNLSLGWTAWYELWKARSGALNKLKMVHAKLHTPELPAAFGFWADYATARSRAEAVARAEREAKSLEHQLRQSRFDCGQLTMLRTAAQDEIRTLVDKTTLLAEEVRTRDVLLDAAARYKEENEALKDQSAFALESAAAAELRKADLEKSVESQLKANQVGCKRGEACCYPPFGRPLSLSASPIPTNPSPAPSSLLRLPLPTGAGAARAFAGDTARKV